MPIYPLTDRLTKCQYFYQNMSKCRVSAPSKFFAQNIAFFDKNICLYHYFLYICNVLIKHTRTMAQLKDLLMDEVLDALVKVAEENKSDRPIIEESIPRLSAHEQRYCRKVCILLNKMRRHNIPIDWDGCCFNVERMMPSGYPMMGYLYVDWDQLIYGFDNDKENIYCSAKVSEVIDFAEKWMSSNWRRVKK